MQTLKLRSRYPHSLHFLRLLQNESFRRHMKLPQSRDLLHIQQFYFWQHYRNNRMNSKKVEE